MIPRSPNPCRPSSVTTKIVCLLGLLAGVLLACAAGAFLLLHDARTDHRPDQDVALHARFVAEIQSPALGLFEIRRLVDRLTGERTRPEQRELVLRLREAERDHHQRHAFWTDMLDDAVIESSLEADYAQPAANYLRLLHERFLPALVRGRPDATLAGEMEAAFRTYRDGAERVASVTQHRTNAIVADRVLALRRRLWQLALVLALALGASAAAGALVVRYVARSPRELATALHPALSSDLDAATAQIKTASARLATIASARHDESRDTADRSPDSPFARDDRPDRAASPRAVPSLRRFFAAEQTRDRFISEIAPDPVTRHSAAPARVARARSAASSVERTAAVTERLKAETASLLALVEETRRLVAQELKNQRAGKR